jgi:hypothetical protein
MSASEHAPDLLSAMPLWVQIAANLGMFAVAVVAAAFGFFRKHLPSFLPAEHFAEGGQFHSLGDDFRDGVSALVAIAESLKAILAIQQAHQRDEDIEREVQRRLAEKQGVTSRV